MCPFFRCENWGKVSSFPSFWIWKEEVLGNVFRGSEKEASCIWDNSLGSWPVPAEEGAQLWEEHRCENKVMQVHPDSGAGLAGTLTVLTVRTISVLSFGIQPAWPEMASPALKVSDQTTVFQGLVQKRWPKCHLSPYQAGPGALPPYYLLPVSGF